MRFFDFSSDWFKIVFSWKNNFHTWKISFGVKICFSDFILLRYLGYLPRDLAPRACCLKHSLWSRKKLWFRLFVENFKMTHFGPNLTQIWAFWSSKIFLFFSFFFLQKYEKSEKYFPTFLQIGSSELSVFRNKSQSR